MKRGFGLAFVLVFLMVFAGCGGEHHSPPTFSTQILSTLANDGDIELTPGNSFIVTQPPAGNQFIRAGFAGLTDEFRAFLDFDLTGPGGVPGSAIIDSATLDVFIDALSPTSTGSLPVFIDLLNFPPNPLLNGDFSATPVLRKNSFIAQSDVGFNVRFDVTQLMQQAQLGQFPHFQVRISQDPTAVADGLVQIHEGTVSGLAPLLKVVYH
jgi:hypothetical protein